MFKGSITALITPFDQNGEIDWKAFENFVEWQIDQGSHGVVPCGTTGECPTVTHAEHKQIVKRCVEVVNKRVPVIAGTGSNSTAEAIEFTQEAKTDGADAALVVTPYYNKPTQAGMIAHYKAINDSADIPMIIYNVPGRCVVDISNATMVELAKLSNVIGVKDATADLSRPLDLRGMIGDEFCQLSGEDATITAYLAQGGHGCISVTANVAPKLCSQLHEAWQKGDLVEMARCRDLLAPLHDAMFCEPSPTPAKYAASRLSLCTDQLRLPLVEATAQCRKTVDDAMDFAGITETSAKTASA